MGSALAADALAPDRTDHMRVYQPKYTKNGERRVSPRWHVEFRDQTGTRRRLLAFTDKAMSEELGRKVVKLLATVVAGERLDPDLARWIERTDTDIRRKLTEWGILSQRATASSRPLSAHLAEWEAALLAKGNTAKSVQLVKRRAQRVFDGCGFALWVDIMPSRVERCLQQLRDGDGDKPGVGRQTSNWYLQAAKQFCAWAVGDLRFAESPLRGLKPLNARPDRRRDRRALAPDELLRLIAAAEDGPEWRGMRGSERALLYRFAAETGLRVSEIASLKRVNFDLEGNEPAVIVEAAYSKHRRRDVQPLRLDLAGVLRDHLAGKTADARAFDLPNRFNENAAKMLRADLEAARTAWREEAEAADEQDERNRSDFLAYVDHAGQYADFHALRHSFISNLARAGVHPKTAQSLARHSTITLTMDRYSHCLRSEERAALDSLPSVVPQRAESKIA